MPLKSTSCCTASVVGSTLATRAADSSQSGDTELFFLPNVPEGTIRFLGRGPLSAVKVTPVGDRFVHEPQEPILTFNQVNVGHPGGDYPTYAVGPDGNFLVFILALVNSAGAAALPETILPDVTDGLTLARHWEAGLTPR